MNNFTNILRDIDDVNNLSKMETVYELLIENADASDSSLPDWIRAAWITVFAGMICVAVGGNCIVIWIVVAHHRMRTVTNYFLVNLSVADLLLTFFNSTFNSFYMIQRHWPFGELYCTVSNFIANTTVAASVYTLTAISCDRYMAIVYPLKPRMSKASSLITVAMIWTGSIAFASPCFFYSTTISFRSLGSERISCIMIWPDNKIVGSKYDLGYQMLFLVLVYLVPMCLMTLSYTVMGKVLWGSRSIGELTERQLESIRSKRKVVKMFALVVSIFGLCWLPYHAYFIYVYFDPTVMYSKYTQHVFLSFYWLAMANAMVNPLIYYWMNARFRQYFRKAVCCWRRLFDWGGSNGGGGGSLPPTPRPSINSYSKSAVVRSLHHRNERPGATVHIDGIPQEPERRRLSSRMTRSTSLKKDTTYL